jgi:hypothetical protein
MLSYIQSRPLWYSAFDSVEFKSRIRERAGMRRLSRKFGNGDTYHFFRLTNANKARTISRHQPGADHGETR